MRKSFTFLAMLGVLVLGTAVPANANVDLTLEHIKKKIDNRLKRIYSSKLDRKYKEKALIQLRNMQGRRNTAIDLSRRPGQQAAAQDLCNQLEREMNNFDKQYNDYKLAASKKKSIKRS